MAYNELVYKINDILQYCNNNKNYIDTIDDEYSDFKNKYPSLFEMIKNNQFDLELFFQMIFILNKIDNKEITQYEGNMQFGSILAKKFNIPMNFNEKDLKNISKKYKIPYNDLKKHYSNLKK